MFPVHSETYADDEFVFVRSETQGWRPTMEDFILCHKIVGLNEEVDDLFGIFDGHGGYYVALFCKTVLPDVMAYNLQLIKGKLDGATDVSESKMIKFALKKSLQDLDIILASQVGHILVTFIIVNENGSKFPESELAPENFKNYILKLVQIQEKILPRGSRVNPLLDFMGCTANVCYIQRKSGKVFVANLGDSKAMHFQKESDQSRIVQVCKMHQLSDLNE